MRERAEWGWEADRQLCGAIYRKLHRDGTTLGQEASLATFQELNDLIGVEERIALAERFGVG